MNDETYLAFQLAMSDQIQDLQKHRKTCVKDAKDWRGNSFQCEVGDVYLKAYRNVLTLISRLQKNPGENLTCYNGQWYTKEEIDKMFYKDIL